MAWIAVVSNETGAGRASSGAFESARARTARPPPPSSSRVRRMINRHVVAKPERI
jgi:hypothetical protein